MVQGQPAVWHACQWPMFVLCACPSFLLGHWVNVGLCPTLGWGLCLALNICWWCVHFLVQVVCLEYFCTITGQCVCTCTCGTGGPGQDSSVETQQTGGPMVGGAGELVSGGASLAFLDPGCRDLPWASLLEAGGDCHFPQRCPVSQV